MSLTIAIADPLDFETLDTLPHIIGRELNLVCATRQDIHDHFRQFYHSGESDGRRTPPRHHRHHRRRGSRQSRRRRADHPAGPANALRSVPRPCFRHPHRAAWKPRCASATVSTASSIHVDTHPKKLLPAIIARLKVMSGTMSIAEKRLPQDGRIQLKMGDKEVDLRVSSVPSNHGESIVMRILDKTGAAARPAGTRLLLRRPGDLRAVARPARRHSAGHRAHRFRQDHHALRLPQRHQQAGPKDHHGGGPGRV